MKFSTRFKLMVENLNANRAIKIIELVFNPPALESEIVQAKKLAKGVLPTDVETFFREMNGFNLEWEHNVEVIKQHNDFDKGFIKILTIQDIFRSWEGTTWFEKSEEDNEYKSVKPLDYFAPEACVAFYQKAEEIPLNTVYYHYFGEYLEDTRYTFKEYLDRLLASRGYFYWSQTLCEGLQKSHEVAVFRKNMPLIFNDYNDDLFHPKTGAK